MSSGSKALVVAGGGTGGHVLAGIAIADSWRAEGIGTEVLFIGAQGGIEERLVPRNGYRLETLKLGSLNRVSILTKLRTLFQLPFTFVKAAKLLRAIRPAAVIGVGGYSSGPVVLMAWILRKLGLLETKCAILEQNAVPGMTNRILGRFVDEIYCAFELTRSAFGPEKRVIVTGNPVRSAMQPMVPCTEKPYQIFVFGGSQGALGMNTLVLEALDHLGGLKNQIQWLHQTGERDFERVRTAHERAGTHAKVEKFVDQMAHAYARSSLLICRAGSSTLSEIAAVGRAAILVPLPTAADNHQEVNALELEKRQGAIVFRQQEGKGSELASLIHELISDSKNLRSMESSVKSFYRPDAARDVSRFLAGIQP